LTILQNKITIKEEQILTLQQELSRSNEDQDKLIKNQQNMILQLHNELEMTKNLYTANIADLEHLVTKKRRKYWSYNF
jgi:hypothetical protein